MRGFIVFLLSVYFFLREEERAPSRPFFGTLVPLPCHTSYRSDPRSPTAPLVDLFGPHLSAKLDLTVFSLSSPLFGLPDRHCFTSSFTRTRRSPPPFPSFRISRPVLPGCLGGWIWVASASPRRVPCGQSPQKRWTLSVPIADLGFAWMALYPPAIHFFNLSSLRLLDSYAFCL